MSAPLTYTLFDALMKRVYIPKHELEIMFNQFTKMNNEPDMALFESIVASNDKRFGRTQA